MPTSRRRIITPPFTDNCVSKAPPSRPTICGSQPSSCNIRCSCLPVKRTLTSFLSSPACRSSIRFGKSACPLCSLQLFRTRKDCLTSTIRCSNQSRQHIRPRALFATPHTSREYYRSFLACASISSARARTRTSAVKFTHSTTREESTRNSAGRATSSPSGPAPTWSKS